MNSITVRHNIECAHRLSQTPGKCENIHGHSMWVELTLYGEVDETGKLSSVEFGDVKAKFRKYLDENFDHHLLLNKNDYIVQVRKEVDERIGEETLPGVITLDRDPTTENLATLIADWARTTFSLGCAVKLNETSVNSATVLNVDD